MSRACTEPFDRPLHQHAFTPRVPHKSCPSPPDLAWMKGGRGRKTRRGGWASSLYAISMHQSRTMKDLPLWERYRCCTSCSEPPIFGHAVRHTHLIYLCVAESQADGARLCVASRGRKSWMLLQVFDGLGRSRLGQPSAHCSYYFYRERNGERNRRALWSFA